MILDQQSWKARAIADHLEQTRPSLMQDVYMQRGEVRPAGATAFDEAMRVRD